jgi:hypothetical protein
MAKRFREGAPVRWKWGSSHATGKVSEVFTRKVTRTLKGADVTKNGSDARPAYLIEQDDGTEVLKLHSELQRAN